MLKRFYRPMVMAGLALAMLTAFVAMPVSAQEMPGSSPGQAMAPLDGGVMLEADNNHWYAFKYDGNGDDDEDPAEAFVVLNVIAGDVQFDVQTADRFGPFDDEEDDPGSVGVGSPAFKGNDDDDEGIYDSSRLIWVGRARTIDTFYVIVHGEGEYTLEITGDSVSFPQWTMDNRDAFVAESN